MAKMKKIKPKKPAKSVKKIAKAKKVKKPVVKAKKLEKPVKLKAKTKPVKELTPKAKPVIEKPKIESKKKNEKFRDEVVVEKEAQESEVVLTDAEGRRYCRVQDCDQVAMVEAYCRYHYLSYWKKIQYRKKILADNKFAKYIEELTAKYPDKFLEVIRRDLTSQKNFMSVIQEMEIDESEVESDNDETKSFIDEVRGMGAEVETTEDDF